LAQHHIAQGSSPGPYAALAGDLKPAMGLEVVCGPQAQSLGVSSSSPERSFLRNTSRVASRASSPAKHHQSAFLGGTVAFALTASRICSRVIRIATSTRIAVNLGLQCTPDIATSVNFRPLPPSEMAAAGKALQGLRRDPVFIADQPVRADHEDVLGIHLVAQNHRQADCAQRLRTLRPRAAWHRLAD